MGIGEFLRTIAATYRTDQGRVSEGHIRLRESETHFRSFLPAGLSVRFGGGSGRPTDTPWIGFLDPDETEDPGEGIYLIYVFSKDLKRVFLSMTQGISNAGLGRTKARDELLRSQSRVIRKHMPPAVLTTTAEEIDLGSTGERQRGYSASNIAAYEYRIDDLPSETELLSDLSWFMKLYQEAIAVKKWLLLTQPGRLVTPSLSGGQGGLTFQDPLHEFKPKSDGDYIAQIAGTTLRKTRRHEALVREYGLHATTLSFTPATNVHPVDMMLTSSDHGNWLVEAKVVNRGNATTAVREATGQLLQYKHFLYPDSSHRLLALFTEDIGAAYGSFLNSIGIAAVWKTTRAWQGCQTAQKNHLAAN